VSESGAEWPDLLGKVTFAYNMTRHETTSYSPYFLFHGRQCSCELDNMTRVPDEEPPTNVHEYALRLYENLQAAFAFVRKHVSDKVERMKRRYDSHVKEQKFTEGVFVWYYYPRTYKGRFRKWSRFYTGPFKLITVVNSTNCIIGRTPRSAPFIVHNDKLKLYAGPEPTVWARASEPVNMPTQRQVDLGEHTLPVGESGLADTTAPQGSTLPPLIIVDPDAPARPRRLHRRPPLRYSAAACHLSLSQ